LGEGIQTMAVRGRLIVNGRRSGAVQLSVSIQFVAAGALQSDAVAIRFSWRAPHTAATAEFDGGFPRRSSGPHPLRQSAVQSQPSVRRLSNPMIAESRRDRHRRLDYRVTHSNAVRACRGREQRWDQDLY